MSEICFMNLGKCRHLDRKKVYNCTAYNERCKDTPHCYYKQLQQLKTENEKLKSDLQEETKLGHKAMCDEADMAWEVTKLQKVLDKIEEIANDDSFPSDFDVYEERDFYFNQLCKIDNILQKIKQAERSNK